MSANKSLQAMRLYYLKRKSRFDSGLGAALPEAYKKFWAEWKFQEPTFVHQIKKEGKWTRNPLTGQVTPIQNVPIPVLYPPEHNDGIWGGEGIVKGFQQRRPMRRRVPHFWIPSLKSLVVYSEVLDKYMRIVGTDRTIDLIHENHGFDNYLLKTPACDLKSELALKLKQQILKTLSEKTLYPDDPAKRDEVYARYEKYVSAYTPEEIEWYGLNFVEACRKISRLQQEQIVFVPLKHQFREKLIAELKELAKEDPAKETESSSSVSWLSKVNPLSRSIKTP
ncbi:39S ribosomal protein L28, mitochondrial [Athalia rosae]|uniref:39S ribosomal protein L28, mitochondrial n=1 Tax=Athalia rosae TaxID=37344 RepID=UPI0020341AE6|nr:39S ribosomal protein L28, mitochondrial [Athalia rosae]